MTNDRDRVDGKEQDLGDVDLSRRGATATLMSALGLVALSSCALDAENAPAEGQISDALNGTTFNWVDNLANLRVIAHTTTSPIVIVQGYATPNDGGFGVFWWDPAATAADNDGTVIRPNNVGAGAPGRWKRLYSGPVNVRWFGAGLGLGSDLARISAGLALLIAAGKGVLFFPSGIYATSGPIDVTGSNIALRGDTVGASRIDGTGSFDTIRVIGTTATIQNVQIAHLHLLENGKTGGNAIFVQNIFQCAILDCLIEFPSAGVRLHHVNTVEFERVRIHAPTGPNSYGFWITGDNNAATDVVTFKNVVVQGVAGTAQSLHSTHGLIVDGKVSTLSAYKLYLNQMDGAGLWFRNSMPPGTGDPEFATFYGIEIEGPWFEAVLIQVGHRFHFTDAQMFGSATRANVTISAPAKSVSFGGGWSRAAAGPGFDLFGQQVSILGVDVAGNAGNPGIQLNPTSRVVTLSGNKCGDSDAANQSHGIRILAGADQFAITGNTCFFNTVSISNGAGLSSSRVITGNAF